jgi:hypothetical protein
MAVDGFRQSFELLTQQESPDFGVELEQASLQVVMQCRYGPEWPSIAYHDGTKRYMCASVRPYVRT